jgi:glutamine synthetase
MDRIHKPVAALAEMLQQLGLPLRSIEKELGPGQIECTFAPCHALEAADNMVLFRTATRQLCRRMGYLASFMCRPGFRSYYSSGWHLHQSLVDRTGKNLFAPDTSGQLLSALGMNYLGGLAQYALPAVVFANPTINAYRRFRANSLAPDRVSWGADHRGTMLRVLSAVNDPASRIENRVGEPAANPYLYIGTQIIAGLEGMDRKLDPGSPDTDPYSTERPMLPKSLPAALKLFEDEPVFRKALGEVFTEYYLRYKRVEIGRYEAFEKEHGNQAGDTTSEWEQNEYFDFF